MTSTYSYSILFHPSFPPKEKQSLLLPVLLCVHTRKEVEMPGIEPGAFHMQSERSTSELHPLQVQNVKTVNSSCKGQVSDACTERTHKFLMRMLIAQHTHLFTNIFTNSYST
jgi:hypothetical protein